MGHQLVALLCSCIKRYGIIYFVICRIGNFLVAPVNGRRGGIDKVLDFMMATGFENIVKTYEIALDIGIGIGDTVTHAGLSREVYDDCNIILSAIDARTKVQSRFSASISFRRSYLMFTS